MMMVMIVIMMMTVMMVMMLLLRGVFCQSSLSMHSLSVAVTRVPRCCCC
jgi:hypothetical protein